MDFNPIIIFFLQFSGGSGDRGSKDDDGTVKDIMPAEDISTKSNAIAAVAVPPVWPHLPLIAVSKIPLFPKFIKIVDVCIIYLLNS